MKMEMKWKWNEMKWMNEWINESINQSMNQIINQSMNQIINQSVSEWMNEWVNEWMNDWVSEWVNEWMNDCLTEWMNEWTNEWMNEKNESNNATMKQWNIKTMNDYVTSYLSMSKPPHGHITSSHKRTPTCRAVSVPPWWWCWGCPPNAPTSSARTPGRTRRPWLRRTDPRSPDEADRGFLGDSPVWSHDLVLEAMVTWYPHFRTSPEIYQEGLWGIQIQTWSDVEWTRHFKRPQQVHGMLMRQWCPDRAAPPIVPQYCLRSPRIIRHDKALCWIQLIYPYQLYYI